MPIKHVVCACLLLIGLPCLGAGYPEKTIRIVTPFPAGSVTDLVARPIAAKLTEAWGQPVIVDNRGGAGGNIAAEAVAKSCAGRLDREFDQWAKVVSAVGVRVN